jgi:hypothetical protein
MLKKSKTKVPSGRIPLDLQRQVKKEKDRTSAAAPSVTFFLPIPLASRAYPLPAPL